MSAWDWWGIPEPTIEYRFAPPPQPRWRFDYAWPDQKIALEVDGGTWRRGGGAHRGKGAIRDMEKGNAALLLGWRVFHVTPEMMTDGRALELIAKAMGTSVVSDSGK